MEFVSNYGYELTEPKALTKEKAVYKCRHNETKEEFVIKWIKWDGDRDSDRRHYDRITRERDICLTLDHQNIVKFVAFFHTSVPNESGSYFYQVMEWCRCDLADWLKDNKSRTLGICLKLLNEIISGLSYLHSNNIMHRDLKPANILISCEGICKLADFDLITKHIKTQTRGHTNSVGTELYAAPELRLKGEEEENASLVREGAYNLKVDVYSLGIIIMEFFTLFRNPKEIETAIQNIRSGLKVPINDCEKFDRSENLKYFLVINELIVKMIKSDPKDRPNLSDVMESFATFRI